MAKRQWPALFLAYLLVCPGPSVAYDALHLVDLQQVLCDPSQGGKGYFDVELSTTELSGAAEYSPHVVAFLRSSNQKTIVSFTLMNSVAKEWDQGPQAVELDYLGARRLNQEVEEEEALGQVTVEEALEQAEELREGGGGEERRLSARRRTSSPRPAPAPSPPRRRTSSPPRRRSASSPAPAPVYTSPRRRSAPAQVGPRRRSTAYVPPGTASTYPNRFSSTGTGGYGYTSQQSMTNNYGGGYPVASNYGYSGTSSYGGSGRSSAGMALGAGFVGGAVVGVGSYYLYHRLTTSECTGYGCCYGCQNSCYGRTGCDSACNNCQMSMKRQYYRDDVLQGAGFYPSDLKPFPLKLRIKSVSGSGYNLSAICPPAGCTAENCSAPAGGAPDDLFVTLTVLEDLDDSGYANEGRRSAQCPTAGALAASVLLLLGLVTGA